MKRIDFYSLYLFARLCEKQNLTTVSRQEHIALSALSKRIQDIEQYYSVTLFRRSKTGMTPTYAGRALYASQQEIHQQLAKMQAEMSHLTRSPKGIVKIHANTSAIIAFLPDELANFCKKYPEIDFDLQECTSSEGISAVREGRSDITIYSATQNSEGLETIPYRSDRLILLTAINHPLASHEIISLRDAQSYAFIGLKQDTSLQKLLEEHSDGKIRMRIQVRSFDGICRLIAKGLGISILPRKTVTSHLQEGNLKSIALLDDWAVRRLNIAFKNYHGLTAASRCFVDNVISSQQTP